MTQIKPHISKFAFVEHTISKLNVTNGIHTFQEPELNSNKLELDYQILSVNHTGNQYNGHLEISVKANVKNSLKQNFKIHLVMNGYFIASSPEDIDENRNKFIDKLYINGTSTLYSIARSVVIDISAKSMASGQVRLPLINIFELHKTRMATAKAQEEREETE